MMPKAVKITFLGIALNAFLAVIKGAAGILGNSYALIADAVESLLDIFHGLVVYSGLAIAAAEPDENHPYGHGKAEPIAAIVASGGLLGAAILLAYASLLRILDPVDVAPHPLTLAVIIIVILLKESMYHLVKRVGDAMQSSVVKTDAWHHRGDAITSLAAFFGILIAVVGGEGYETADDWAALVACAIIAYNGTRLLLPALGEIMDTAPPPTMEKTVRETADKVQGVSGTDVCLVRKMGFDYYVDLHVLVDGMMSVRDGHEVAHQVKDAIREEDPRIRNVLVHIEPDDMAEDAKKPAQ